MATRLRHPILRTWSLTRACWVQSTNWSCGALHPILKFGFSWSSCSYAGAITTLAASQPSPMQRTGSAVPVPIAAPTSFCLRHWAPGHVVRRRLRLRAPPVFSLDMANEEVWAPCISCSVVLHELIAGQRDHNSSSRTAASPVDASASEETRSPRSISKVTIQYRLSLSNRCKRTRVRRWAQGSM